MVQQPQTIWNYIFSRQLLHFNSLPFSRHFITELYNSLGTPKTTLYVESYKSLLISTFVPLHKYLPLTPLKELYPFAN